MELINITNQLIGNERVNTVSLRELHKYVKNVDYIGCKVFNTLANQDYGEV